MEKLKNGMLIIFVALICYVLLVAGDWIVEKSSSGELFKGSDDTATQQTHINYLRALILNEESVVEENLANGYVPSISPTDFESQPSLKDKTAELNIAAIGGIPNTDVFIPCDEGYGPVRFQSDRFGLRNADTKWDHEVDTLFIGDSFMYGECVDSDYVISSQYESMTGKVAVNLAGTGNNPRHYAALAELFIPKVKPDEVFIVFYPNDKGVFDADMYEIHVNNRAPFFDEQRKGLYPLDTYDSLQQFAVNYFSETRSLNTGVSDVSLFKRIQYRAGLPTLRQIFSTASSSLLGDSQTAIDAAVRNCRTSGCDVKVVYIPNSDFWDPDPQAVNYANELKQYAILNHLVFYDASDVIQTRLESDDYAVKGPHLSPSGYHKVATLISGH